jgi:hypothetical protein
LLVGAVVVCWDSLLPVVVVWFKPDVFAGFVAGFGYEFNVPEDVEEARRDEDVRAGDVVPFP